MMPSQVTNYQCPACTAPLRFDSSTGRLQCDYCGSSFSPEEIEAFYAGKDAQAEQAFQQAEQAAQPGEPGTAEGVPQVVSQAEKAEMLNSRWDESTIGDNWGQDSANMRTFSCPSCGAELLCEMTTAATQCPYCGNPSIVPGQFTSSLRPDYVIPFRLDKEAAVAALKKHFGKRIFLPSAFTKTSEISKIQGVYVPFWLFSGSAAAECCFEGENSHTHREGDYRVTRTDHYDVRRSGTVQFQNIPTDASRKMPDQLMDSIEPFDYSELKPFSTAYLPGYLADKYDVTIEENSQRADLRCTNTTLEVMRQDVRGYQMVKTLHNDVYLNRGEVRYALLPVWILNVKWNQKNFLFAMNGQTGKFVGDLPVDKKRFWALCAGITAALGCLFFFTGIGNILAQLIQEILADFLM